MRCVFAAVWTGVVLHLLLLGDVQLADTSELHCSTVLHHHHNNNNNIILIIIVRLTLAKNALGTC